MEGSIGTQIYHIVCSLCIQVVFVCCFFFLAGGGGAGRVEEEKKMVELNFCGKTISILPSGYTELNCFRFSFRSNKMQNCPHCLRDLHFIHI